MKFRFVFRSERYWILIFKRFMLHTIKNIQDFLTARCRGPT